MIFFLFPWWKVGGLKVEYPWNISKLIINPRDTDFIFRYDILICVRNSNNLFYSLLTRN